MISEQLFITGDGFGTIAIPFLCVAVFTPYLVGFNAPPKPLRLEKKTKLSPRDKLKELRIHYWVSYVAVAATLVHVVIPVVAGVLGMMNAWGLWFGVVSAVFLVLLVPSGIFLQSLTLIKRTRWRRLHFWFTIGCAATLVMHVYYCWHDLRHIIVATHLAH